MRIRIEQSLTIVSKLFSLSVNFQSFPGRVLSCTPCIAGWPLAKIVLSACCADKQKNFVFQI